MLDNEKSFGFGNALSVKENEFHEKRSKIYLAFKTVEIYHFSNL